METLAYAVICYIVEEDTEAVFHTFMFKFGWFMQCTTIDSLFTHVPRMTPHIERERERERIKFLCLPQYKFVLNTIIWCVVRDKHSL